MRKRTKTAPLVKVTWEDSRQPAPSWAHLATRDKPSAVQCVSVGWLIYDGKDAIAVAANMGDLEGGPSLQVSGVIEIPTCCIKKMQVLSEDGYHLDVRRRRP